MGQKASENAELNPARTAGERRRFRPVLAAAISLKPFPLVYGLYAAYERKLLLAANCVGPSGIATLSKVAIVRFNPTLECLCMAMDVRQTL